MIPAISTMAFVAVFALVVGLGGLLLRLFAPEQEPSGITPYGDGFIGRLITGVAQLNRDKESLADVRAYLDRRLKLAGRPLGEGGACEFLAILELTGLAILVIVAALLMLAGNGAVTALVTGGAVGGAGVGLGIAWLQSVVQDRERAISRQYPYFLDLAVMTMEAGSTFQQAAVAYVRDSPPAPLREELQMVLQDLDLGLSEQDTLGQLRERISSADVRDSVHMVIQGLRAGTRLGRLLRDQAEGLRFRRSQLAERIAEELKIRIMGPATMMMAAVILLILGPVAVNITQSGIM